jgi:sterol desaturase/sphingolipid hydroxylase (fatty acid hydroxylase superfamily)
VVATFLRHGSNGVLIGAIALVLALRAFGWFALPPLWVIFGALLFYLSEYTFHRYAFHAKPSSWAWLRRMQHRLHYDHHAEPNRLDLLFLPLWFLLPIVAFNGALVSLIFGAPRVPAILLGMMLGVLHYEWVHYVAHVPYAPRTRFGRWMKQYHLRHHFISEKLWFGVSNPSLDLLYGTYRSPKDVEKSGTVRKLYS